jgi:hypothetical protein
MNNLIFYIYEFGYPIFLLLFVVGSAIHFKNDRNLVSAGVLVGFSLMFAGYLLQNYGPSNISYTEDRTAHIRYTWLFSVGYYASGLGTFLASACYLLIAKRNTSPKNA